MFFTAETVTLCLGFVVFIGIYSWFISEKRKKAKDGRTCLIPGPRLVDKKTGHNADIAAAGNLSQYLRQQHAIYGPIFAYYHGPDYTVSLGTPTAFNQARKPFDRPPGIDKVLGAFFGSSSLEVTHGEEGKKRHAALTRFLSFGAVSPYFPIMQNKVIELCKVWLSHEGKVQVADELRKYAIVSVETSLFRGYVPDDKEVMDYIETYEDGWKQFERHLKGDIIGSGSEREKIFQKKLEEIHIVLRKLYNNAAKEQSDEGDSFMKMAESLNLDEKAILDDVFTCIAGGFHNSYYAMEWGMYFLAKNPRIQEKMYTEIQDVLGDEPITADAVKYLVYVRQFIDEIQRWATVGTFSARMSDEDLEIEGYFIPAHTPLMFALETVHFDQATYTDPERFDPDRFAPELRKSYPPHSLEPFGFAGGRRCPGSQVFNIEATIMFTTVLQKLQLSLPQGDEEIHKELGTFSKPHRRVQVLVKSR